MKDLYSFTTNREEHDKFYALAEQAYMKVYKRLGIGDITYKTMASGGPFSKFSHEFQTIADIGEDTVYLSDSKKLAVNQEVLSDEVLHELGLSREELTEKKAVEVGNIFTFGSRYSEPLGLFYTDEKGIQQPVFAGSYGIGISRLMGLLAELFADDKGLIWPAEVAPSTVYLARLGDSRTVVEAADKAYSLLTDSGIGVLYDDRKDATAGAMFADADLLGLPYRIVVSNKTVQSGELEIKERTSQNPELISPQNLAKFIAKD